MTHPYKVVIYMYRSPNHVQNKYMSTVYNGDILGKIMACFIMTGEIMGGDKYGGISPKPPIFHGHNFTCDFCLVNFFLNFKRIYSFLSVPDALASTMLNDDIWVFIVNLNIVFSLSLHIFTVNCVLQNKTSLQLD